MVEDREVKQWAEDLERMASRIQSHFARIEVFTRAKKYLRGLLSSIDRKNGWQMAEAAGDKNPDGVQYLLARAEWNPDRVRDDLQNYVTEHLGNNNGIFVVDETGFLKKGKKSVGVQRQYSGTAGRIENSQIGVFLGYATEKGYTLIDRELYLPESWTSDKERCLEAGVPEEVKFQTKPQLARKMLEKAFSNGIPGKWVTGDSVYGNNEKFRRWLEEQEKSYVLAVSSKVYIWKNFEQVKVSSFIPKEDAWQQLSAGNGSKGPRIYDWIRIKLNTLYAPGWEKWLLMRRSLDEKKEITYYFVFCQANTTFREMVQIAGSRWTIEECFEIAKDDVGLDQYEVRKWQGWYRHITLVLFAQAFLTVLKSQQCFSKKGIFKALPSKMAMFKVRRNRLSLLQSRKLNIFCTG